MTAEGSSENRTEQRMEGDGLMGTEASSKMNKLSHSEVTRALTLNSKLEDRMRHRKSNE